MSTVISVENVSKSYRLGAIGGSTLKEDVSRWWAKARKKPDPTVKIGDENKARLIGDEFKALDHVSFQVEEGEVLGIIGRNGAGKSTLLKILSQVTAPTSGEIKIRGRVASLLEVGTGFHPELTGRENVFLNGAILGMTRAEIRIKFDEIINFSGIGEFIDTPVKRYSSGMYVRLAFAVAAHLESEILIVDEVLAVGDAEFQEKCIGKMEETAEGGRTVLFVSHNMAAMRALCSRAMLFEQGTVTFSGPIEEAASVYLNARASHTYIASKLKLGTAHIAGLTLRDAVGLAKDMFEAAEPIVVEIDIVNPHSEPLEVALAFFDSSGNKLWNFDQGQSEWPPIVKGPTCVVEVRFSPPCLQVSEVFVHVGLRRSGSYVRHYIDHITEGIGYRIKPSNSGWYERSDCLLRCHSEFEITQ